MIGERPLLTVSIAACAGFFLVFSAAMAGTAFMLTGGFGGDDPRSAANIEAFYEDAAKPAAPAAQLTALENVPSAQASAAFAFGDDGRIYRVAD